MKLNYYLPIKTTYLNKIDSLRVESRIVFIVGGGCTEFENNDKSFILIKKSSAQ